jgi:hypothetical protein
MNRGDNLQLQREWYKRNNANPEWKATRNQMRAQQRRDNKRKAVDYFGRQCYDCKGVWQDDCVYDFHHLDISRDNITPSQVLHCGWDTILKELSGCVLLCSNCHRIRHSKDGYTHHSKRNGKAKY